MIDEPTIVGETHFFRHPLQFEHMLSQVLEPWQQAGRSSRLRIWSVGCANGAEPYTLAMLLDSRLPGGLGSGQIEMLGSDVSSQAIAQARLGRYNEWHLRGCPESYRLRYFRREGDEWVLDRALVARVQFEVADLRQQSGPPDCQLILCRNVLIYYPDEVVERAMETLCRSLIGDGHLYLGFTEALLAGRHPCFQLVDTAVAAYRRKSGLRPCLLPSWRAPVQTMTPAPAPAPARPPRPPEATPAPQRPEPSRPAPAAETNRPAAETNRPAADRAEALELVRRAASWAEQDGAEQARECLRQSIYLDPELAVAYFRLGLLDWSQGRLPAARRAWRNVLKLAQGQPWQAQVPGWEQCDWERLYRETQAHLERLDAL